MAKYNYFLNSLQIYFLKKLPLQTWVQAEQGLGTLRVADKETRKRNGSYLHCKLCQMINDFYLFFCCFRA